MQALPLPPCPECGERQALFECNGGHYLSIQVGLLVFSSVQLYACTCLTCGYTVLRVRPEDIGRLRKAEEEGKAVQF